MKAFLNSEAISSSKGVSAEFFISSFISTENNILNLSFSRHAFCMENETDNGEIVKSLEYVDQIGNEGKEGIAFGGPFGVHVDHRGAGGLGSEFLRQSCHGTVRVAFERSRIYHTSRVRPPLHLGAKSFTLASSYRAGYSFWGAGDLSHPAGAFGGSRMDWQTLAELARACAALPKSGFKSKFSSPFLLELNAER